MSLRRPGNGAGADIGAGTAETAATRIMRLRRILDCILNGNKKIVCVRCGCKKNVTFGYCCAEMMACCWMMEKP